MAAKSTKHQKHEQILVTANLSIVFCVAWMLPLYNSNMKLD